MKKFVISKGAEFVLTRLAESGFSAYLVGGCVRDFVMDKIPHDFDVTTCATPEEMLEVFKDVTTFKSGITHGTVGVHVFEENVEATTFRADGEYVDHRHPEKVEFSRSLTDDLSRRDFTMNALVYNENEGVYDLFGGLDDIEKKIIRCVGVPEKRFEEDALRILRALRFSSVLDFDIDSETRNAIFKKKQLLTFISRERIAEELIKLLGGVRRERVAEEYKEVFDVIFKELNVDATALKNARESESALAVFFAKSEFYKENVLSLKLPKILRDKVILSIELFLKGVPEERQSLKELISIEGQSTVALALDIHSAFYGESKRNEYFNELVNSGECITLDSLAIKGRDIIALGVKPSAEVGEILKKMLNLVLNGEVENRKEKLVEKIKGLQTDNF